MRSFFKSIRWQIQAWYGLLLLLATVAFSIFSYQLAWIERGREIDRRLAEKALLVVTSLRKAALETSPVTSLLRALRSDQSNMISGVLLEPLKAGEIPIPEMLQSTFVGEQSGYYYYRILDYEGTTVLESPNAPATTDLLPIPGQGVVETSRWADNRRERVVGDESGLRLVVGQEISGEMAGMGKVKLLIGGIGLGVWVLGLLGGWVISGYAIRPIQSISESAVRISEGNLSERIQPSGFRNELSDLAAILNTTFARLQAAFKRQQQFTADASHELRTPVTTILSETQRMRKRPRTVGEYQDSVEICHAAGMRMKKLVEDLLLLARQDGKDKGPQMEACKLDDLIRDSLGSMQVIAADKGITIHVDLEPVTLKTDPEKLLIVINNILGNAIYHHHGKGNVWIAVRPEDKVILISIRDDGRGISERDLPHIFERFYRADTARSSADMHSGLGLSVCKTIVAQLDGEIAVSSEFGKGSQFSVRLPLGK